MKKRKAPLTVEELEFLNGPNVSPMIRKYAIARAEEIRVGTPLYHDLAEHARAERIAMEEVTRLAIAKSELKTLEDAQKEVQRLQRQAQALEVTNRQLEEQVTRAIAAPSMAVNSSD